MLEAKQHNPATWPTDLIAAVARVESHMLTTHGATSLMSGAKFSELANTSSAVFVAAASEEITEIQETHHSKKKRNKSKGGSDKGDTGGEKQQSVETEGSVNSGSGEKTGGPFHPCPMCDSTYHQGYKCPLRQVMRALYEANQQKINGKAFMTIGGDMPSPLDDVIF